jgi:hypothetical protein
MGPMPDMAPSPAMMVPPGCYEWPWTPVMYFNLSVPDQCNSVPTFTVRDAQNAFGDFYVAVTAVVAALFLWYLLVSTLNGCCGVVVRCRDTMSCCCTRYNGTVCRPSFAAPGWEGLCVLIGFFWVTSLVTMYYPPFWNGTWGCGLANWPTTQLLLSAARFLFFLSLCVWMLMELRHTLPKRGCWSAATGGKGSGRSRGQSKQQGHANLPHSSTTTSLLRRKGLAITDLDDEDDMEASRQSIRTNNTLAGAGAAPGVVVGQRVGLPTGPSAALLANKSNHTVNAAPSADDDDVDDVSNGWYDDDETDGDSLAFGNKDGAAPLLGAAAEVGDVTAPGSMALRSQKTVMRDKLAWTTLITVGVVTVVLLQLALVFVYVVVVVVVVVVVEQCFESTQRRRTASRQKEEERKSPSGRWVGTHSPLTTRRATTPPP